MEYKKTSFISVLLILVILAGHTIYAQSLPNKQKVSFYAPIGLKIDGKISEWNKFQAYNHATGIFYTLANDNDKLYLIVQAIDPLIIRKIINGGITFKINVGKKSDNIAVTYPVFSKANRPAINLKEKPLLSKNSGPKNMQLDSFVSIINKRFIDKAKEIKIHGIKSISDSLISVYNQDDIKVAALFDNTAAYTYELSIPLKYVGISATKSKKINYNITLSGSDQVDGMTITPAKNNVEVVSISVGAGAPPIPTQSESAILLSATDFDGEYTLASK